MNNKKKDGFDGPECGNCAARKGKAGQPLSQKCSRCKIVSYCSRECQVQHWKSGGHKKWCLTPKERSVQQFALANKKDREATAGLNSDSSSCLICLEPIDSAKTDLNVTLPCLHVFHISCVEGLRSHAMYQACPLCRAELPSAKSRCSNCGNKNGPTGAPLVKCPNCKDVSYCGRDCQRAHWKNGGHKAICAQATSQRAVAAALNEPLYSVLGMQLITAAYNNQISKVRQLLEQGAEVNERVSDKGFHSLYAAAQEGHTEVVGLLIGGGAAVNQATDKGLTSLYVAASEGHSEVVGLLIGGGAAVNQVTDKGLTSLYIAASEGHAEVVGLLIGGGAAVNQARTDDGTTPLFVAASLGHTEVASLLIGCGAAVNQVRTDSAGWSPLFIAAYLGHADVAQILLAAGADKTAPTSAEHADVEAGCTPISIALRHGYSRVSELFLS